MYLNQLVEESFIATLDKGFSLSGETMAAGTNLITLNSVKVAFQFGYGYVVVRFMEELIEEADFTNEMFTFRIAVMMTDNTRLSNEITIEMNLP